MALGATQFNAPAIVPDFSAGMPMVTPVQVLPAQEAKSPIDTLKEVFFDIRDGIKNLVDQHVDNRTYHQIKPKYEYKA